jgi:Icc-related predicted phosphoesterase
MKILFTADLHGLEAAFVDFAHILQIGNFKCGVIAGDLIDDGLTHDEFIELLSVAEDDLLSELPGADETLDEMMQREIKKLHDPKGFFMQALAIKERRFKEILFTAKKPIFIIRGNHDLTDWSSESNIHNIHWRKVNFQGFNFVGYHHTEFSRTQEQQRKDFETLEKYIDDKTIFITHIPAFGVLDRQNHDDPSWSLGSRALSELIHRNKPLVHIHGHVHQASGNKGFSFNASYPQKRQFLYLDLNNMDSRGWIDPCIKPTPELRRHESGHVTVHGPAWYDMPIQIIEKYIRMAEQEEYENMVSKLKEGKS